MSKPAGAAADDAGDAGDVKAARALRDTMMGPPPSCLSRGEKRRACVFWGAVYLSVEAQASVAEEGASGSAMEPPPIDAFVPTGPEMQ